MNDLLTSIKKMAPNGNRLELPCDDHFANYAQVKKCLLAAGGKYKRNGFEFPEPADAIQARLLAGEAIDDVKKWQFFQTPPTLARQMIDLADIKKGHDVLEPSAGTGRLIAAMPFADPAAVVAVESNPSLADQLRDRWPSLHVRCCDFLRCDGDLDSFDRIVMNPPFTKGQDIAHVRHAYDFLKPGGRIVAIMSEGPFFRSDRKAREFREWLDERGAVREQLPADTFKTSGTGVNTRLVVIEKD